MHTLYLVYDGHGVESYRDTESLFRVLFACDQYDVAVHAFNPCTGTAPDVSEAIADEYWRADGQAEAIAAMENNEPVCGLLRRYYAPELRMLAGRMQLTTDRMWAGALRSVAAPTSEVA